MSVSPMSPMNWPMNKSSSTPTLHPSLSPLTPLNRSSSMPQFKRLPRLNAGGKKALGRQIPSTGHRNVRARPKQVGAVLQKPPSAISPPRLPKLKAPKIETRNVELRGMARKLQMLTKGVQKVYPLAMPMDVFVEEATRVLADMGFNASNSLAVVGLTRDEVTRPLLHAVTRAMGEPYVTHSLGGQFNVGKEGIKQMLNRAPQKTSGARPKLVFITGPNLAVNQDGDTGIMYRKNRPEPVDTNSELLEFVRKFKTGTFNLHRNPRSGFEVGDDLDLEMLTAEDLELTVLHQKLSRQMIRDGGMNNTDLASVARVAARSALHDIEGAVGRYVNLSKVDVAVVSLVQVHGQYHDMGKAEDLKYMTEFVAPQVGYAIVNGGEKIWFRKAEGIMALEMYKEEG